MNDQAGSPVGAPAARQVTFFDLDLLVGRAGAGYRLREEAVGLLLGTERRGVLAEAPDGIERADIAGLLELAGIDGLFEPGLVVVASALGCSLAEPRAYAVAAALAMAPAGACAFATLMPDRRQAAASAGLATPVPPSEPQPAATPSSRGRGATETGAPPAPPLGGGPFRAGEIDPDTGPAYILRGRVVTMDGDGRVLDDARVIVDRGQIAGILGTHAAVPAAYHDAPVVETGGTIYPGLIDLHNHFVYNVLPFWPVKKAWTNRTEWAKDAGYSAEISLPIHLLVSSPQISRAIVRYVEAKALIGGTTTGQGIRTQVRGGARLFRGAMRNVEETNDPRLPEAGTRVPNLGRRPVDFAAFAASLVRRGEAGGAYFYHLAEGTNEMARRTYTDLRDHHLLRPALAGIHSLALEPDDLARLAGDGARLVWSPFSNLLLYGRTLDLKALSDSGVTFSIGSDWSPTGSKNLLEELKVARFEVARQGASFTARDLVAAVTSQPARILGWQGRVGAIVEGALADLLVIAGSAGDPHQHLIDAVEGDVALVVTHGVARYGRRTLVKAATPAGLSIEPWTQGSSKQAFQLSAPESGIDDLTFAVARDALATAAADLPAFRESLVADRARSRAFGVDPDAGFSLVLDNEPEPAADDGLRASPERADWSHLPATFELDEPWVGGGTYWSRLDLQHNVSQALRDMLRAAYKHQ